MPLRTYQPSKRTRKQQFGFRARMKTENGQDIIRRRRNQGRKRLVPKGVEIKFRRHCNSTKPAMAHAGLLASSRAKKAAKAAAKAKA